MINKNFYRKTNDKKILHKVGKQWKVISVALLMAIGGGAVAAHTVNADASNNNGVNAATSAEVNALEQKPAVPSAVSAAPSSASAKSASAKPASSVSYQSGYNGSAASYHAKALNDNAQYKVNSNTVQKYVNSLNVEFPVQTASLNNNYNSAATKTSADQAAAQSYSAISNNKNYSSQVSALASKAGLTYSGFVQSVSAQANIYNTTASSDAALNSQMAVVNSYAQLISNINSNPAVSAQYSARALSASANEHVANAEAQSANSVYNHFLGASAAYQENLNSAKAASVANSDAEDIASVYAGLDAATTNNLATSVLGYTNSSATSERNHQLASEYASDFDNGGFGIKFETKTTKNGKKVNVPVSLTTVPYINAKGEKVPVSVASVSGNVRGKIASASAVYTLLSDTQQEDQYNSASVEFNSEIVSDASASASVSDAIKSASSVANSANNNLASATSTASADAVLGNHPTLAKIFGQLVVANNNAGRKVRYNRGNRRPVVNSAVRHNGKKATALSVSEPNNSRVINNITSAMNSNADIVASAKSAYNTSSAASSAESSAEVLSAEYQTLNSLDGGSNVSANSSISSGTNPELKSATNMISALSANDKSSYALDSKGLASYAADAVNSLDKASADSGINASDFVNFASSAYKANDVTNIAAVSSGAPSADSKATTSLGKAMFAASNNATNSSAPASGSSATADYTNSSVTNNASITNSANAYRLVSNLASASAAKSSADFKEDEFSALNSADSTMIANSGSGSYNDGLNGLDANAAISAFNHNTNSLTSNAVASVNKSLSANSQSTDYTPADFVNFAKSAYGSLFASINTSNAGKGIAQQNMDTTFATPITNNNGITSAVNYEATGTGKDTVYSLANSLDDVFTNASDSVSGDASAKSVSSASSVASSDYVLLYGSAKPASNNSSKANSNANKPASNNNSANVMPASASEYVKGGIISDVAYYKPGMASDIVRAFGQNNASNYASLANSVANNLTSAQSASNAYSVATDENVTLAGIYATSYSDDVNSDEAVESAAKNSLDDFYAAHADANYINASSAAQSYSAAEPNDAALAHANGVHVFNYAPKYVRVIKNGLLHNNTDYVEGSAITSVPKGTELTVLGVGFANDGTTRYSVNYKGHNGYFTANTGYVVPTFLAAANNVNVTVNRQAKVYKSANFAVKGSYTGKTLPEGAQLTNVNVVSQDNLFGGFTRIETPSGNWFTANTKYVSLTDASSKNGINDANANINNNVNNGANNGANNGVGFWNK